MQTWRHTNRSLERMLRRARPDHHHIDQLFIGRRMFSLRFQNCSCALFVEKALTPSRKSEQLSPDLKFEFHIQNSWKGSRQSNEFASVNQFSLSSLPVSISLISFHWIRSSEDPQRHHFLHWQRWSYCSHSSWSLGSLRHRRSFDSAISSQKLVWFWRFLSVMVCFVSQLAQTGSFTERYHLLIFHLIMWCSTRIRSRPAFSLSIWLLWAQLYPEIVWNIICMLMTLNFTFRSNLLVFINLQIFFLQLSVSLFLGHTTTNSCWIHLKLNCFWLVLHNRGKSFLMSLLFLSVTLLFQSAHRLGTWVFIFNSDMSLASQVNLVCKSSHFHIRDIRRIRNLIPPSVAITLANSLVSSRLDYCNSLYFGMCKQNIQKLQRVQNSLARAITQTSKYQHITPVLKDFHLLPVTQRIEYKISLLTFKTIMNGPPSYLHQLFIPQTHYSSTRSSRTSALFIPRTRTSFGKRAFSVAAPRIWNALPAVVRTTTSVSSFRSKLKTHFLKIAFPP